MAALPPGKRRWQSDSNSNGNGGRDGPTPSHKRAARGGGGGGGGGPAAPPTARGAYGALFERFRQQLDAHHDRRERVVKASRDVTAQAKKVIFALQRVRQLGPALPADVDADVRARLADIGRLLAGVAPLLQGLDRGRHGRVLFGMEELVEALAFLHYLRHQTLLRPDEAAAQVQRLCEEGRAALAETDKGADKRADKWTGKRADTDADTDANKDVNKDADDTSAPVPVVHPDDNDYIMGVFDLSGEMMRFATTSAALRGELAGTDTADTAESTPRRTIVGDMQALDSFFRMLPQRHDRAWTGKMAVLQTSVQKVERLGYDLRVRGSERPKGWVPEAGDEGASP